MHYKEAGMISDRQFGFKRGRSTEDAFISLRHGVASSDKKYVVAIFVDIKGAFDNIWWPGIIHRIVQAGCSDTLISVIKDYFNNRLMTVGLKFERLTRKMERGCPL